MLRLRQWWAAFHQVPDQQYACWPIHSPFAGGPVSQGQINEPNVPSSPGISGTKRFPPDRLSRPPVRRPSRMAEHIIRSEGFACTAGTYPRIEGQRRVETGRKAGPVGIGRFVPIGGKAGWRAAGLLSSTRYRKADDDIGSDMALAAADPIADLYCSVGLGGRRNNRTAARAQAPAYFTLPPDPCSSACACRWSFSSTSPGL